MLTQSMFDTKRWFCAKLVHHNSCNLGASLMAVLMTLRHPEFREAKLCQRTSQQIFGSFEAPNVLKRQDASGRLNPPLFASLVSSSHAEAGRWAEVC